MNLQKNDKIILVVGVVILIAAAGAIAIYTTQSNGEDKNHTDQSDQMMTYDVGWTIKTRTLDSKTYSLNLPSILSFLNKGKSASDNNFFTVDQDNIKLIEINVSFTDNKMGLPLLGFLGSGALGIGKDELMVTITDPDEMDYKTVIKGNGKNTIEIEGKVRPFSTSIDAESFEEAEMKLEENYSTEWSGESFELKANLKISERLRLFNRIFERFFKDTFKIDVTYHYYEYSLMENLEENNNEDSNDEDSETGIGDFYNLMSYGRQMI